MILDLGTDLPYRNLGRQMSKFMEQMQKGYYNFCPSETWTPNVNLYETDLAYIVCVDLAGVDKEKIDVEVVETQLKLRGMRNVPMHMEQLDAADTRGQRIRVHLMEIDHGQFCREVDLPRDVLQDQISATYRNGLLWVELPKKK